MLCITLPASVASPARVNEARAMHGMNSVQSWPSEDYCLNMLCCLFPGLADSPRTALQSAQSVVCAAYIWPERPPELPAAPLGLSQAVREASAV